jgi:hypothetical protein
MLRGEHATEPLGADRRYRYGSEAQPCGRKSGVGMYKVFTSIVLIALATPALAADSGVYIGGSLGRATLKDNAGALHFDGNDTGFKIIAGFRPLDWLAVETNYVDFGKPDDQVAGEAVKANGNGVSAFAVGFFAVGPVDVFAKAGLINWRAKFRASSLNFSRNEDGTDFAYGAGAQFRLGSLGLRAEYEKFNADVHDLNMLSVGVTWTFL